MQLSIAICTWNRCELLHQTLMQMRQLLIPPGVDWEILIVNNNCTDNTDQVISGHANHLPIVRLLEKKQGLSNARNCAMEAARGSLLLWTDDDVIVDEGWVDAYFNAAQAWPDATFFGGTIDPWFEIDPPQWLQRNINRVAGAYALRQFGNTIRLLAKYEYPFGANFAFRMKDVDGLRFDSRLGRHGDEMIGAEETGFIDQLRNAGRNGVWVGTARVRHFIPRGRISKRYLWDYYKGSGRTHIRQTGLPICPYVGDAPRWAVRRYASRRLLAWYATPLKSPRWLAAFREAALLSGIIEECRSKRREIRLASNQQEIAN